jgi:oxygen-independent coproporphyrinogen-3 oxidase
VQLPDDGLLTKVTKVSGMRVDNVDSPVPGVYISYPFCRQKCTFCNFSSGVAAPNTVPEYERTLLTELRAQNWPWLPETLYFGGGTPSLISSGFLHEIMNAVPGRPWAEATLECAPGTVTPERAVVWRAAGINRISLGVQSFVAAELRQTGRTHTVEIVENEITVLRDAGLANINIDLIAGLPEQTAESWERSLDWIARLDPPHVSVYIFEVDEDSRLGNEVLLNGIRYGARRMPSDDLIAQLYERAVDRLAQKGWARYEISNFARPGFESHHNLKYWRLEPYLGFGLDAHSFDGTHRWSNTDSLESYLSKPLERAARTASDLSEEHFFVGLRLAEGIVPAPHEWERFAQPIERWLEAGMLEQDGARLRLAPAAVLLSNEIFQEFLRA